MKKIVYYQGCLTLNLKNKYEWSVAVWLNTGMFADAYIKMAKQPFETSEEAIKDMNATLALFGVTKKTPTYGSGIPGYAEAKRKKKK